jgi:AraC-like DNA-binding protein
MQVFSYAPRAPLGRFVERLWWVSGGQSPRKERILPSGTVELVVNLRADRITIDRTMDDSRVRSYSGSVVSGPYSGAFVIDAMQHESMMGVHFRPGGAFAVLGIPGDELADAHVDLGAIANDAFARELRERLCGTATHEARFSYLEHALTTQFRARAALHPVVELALERFTTTGLGASVRDVVRESGLSHRRFLTIFRTEVGLSPKRYCRILRFRHLHELAQRTGCIDWAELAQECGFFDQSHLAGEFRKLSGLTPTEYQRDLASSRSVLAGHIAIS